MLRPALFSKLDRVGKLAASSKLHRFFAAPIAYFTAAIFSRLVYPSRKKPLLRKGKTFYGLPFSMALPAGTDIYLTGGKTHISELRLARFLIHRLKAGHTYIDVGAHYGFFAGLAAVIDQNIHVQAFEPAPATFQILQQNLGHLNNVRLQQLGLGHEVDTLTFYQFPARYSEYNSLDIEQYQNESWIKDFPPTAVQVKVTTLDEALNAPPDFLKIDVEGAEDLVIQGGQRILQAGKTTIIMEYLPRTKSNGSHFQALQLLQQWGYHTYQLTDTGKPAPCPNPEKWLKDSGQDSANLIFTLPQP